MAMPKRQRMISKEKKEKQRSRLPEIARISACAVVLFALPAVVATAQSSTEAAPTAQLTPSSAATPTLRVYTNLKQVPVLVLTHDYERMKPIDASGFRLSIDSGPLFHPTYVRREGDDPISLAILIDESDPKNELLPPLTQALAALPPDFLHPQDHVSVYAIDCDLIRTTYDAPASPTLLADGVQSVMALWQTRQKQNQELKQQKKAIPPPCKPSFPLWDAIGEVLLDLEHQPGRRVLLAITNGKDSGSRTPWKNVMLFAQIHSVAVFGLLPTITTTYKLDTPGKEMRHIESPSFGGPENKFEQICVNSGGVQLQATEHTTMFRLKEFTDMLRERYILEYPRATSEEAGIHTIEVTYKKKRNLYIATTGITVPIASEDEKKGLNTIQGDPAKAPTDGDRKVLLPK